MVNRKPGDIGCYSKNTNLWALVLRQRFGFMETITYDVRVNVFEENNIMNEHFLIPSDIPEGIVHKFADYAERKTKEWKTIFLAINLHAPNIPPLQ
jgi:hypothetical protein